MDARARIPSYAELLEFAQSCEGAELRTVVEERGFEVRVSGEDLYFKPAGKAERHARPARVQAVLSKLQESGSWKPADYSEDSFNASYVLALTQACQSAVGNERARPIPAKRRESRLREEQKDQLRASVRAAVRHRDCAVREDRLQHGLHVELRAAVRNGWIGSAYWSDNAPGNDVEIAFDPPRLARTAAESLKVSRWVVATSERLGMREARNHSGDHHDWFRAGFEFANSLLFFEALAAQTNPLILDAERWALPSTPSRAGVEAAADTGQQAPHQGSLNHMLAMAKQACGQSGEVQTTVAKTKEFRFQSDDEFHRHVEELLVRQQSRCALTKLPLQFAGEAEDEELLASLDRIDSDGHYAAGNLQVVCRFANRWKSDDDDRNVRRLIALLQSQGSM